MKHGSQDKKVTRRSFIGAGSVTAALIWPTLASSTTFHETCEIALPPSVEVLPDAAVSLARLSADLKQSAAGRHNDTTAGTLWSKANRLYGLREIYGFLPDKKTGDIILVGTTKGLDRDLKLEDMVVAIRSELRQYPTLKDGQEVHYRAGVSLDPIDKLWAKMKDAPRGASKVYCASRNYSRVLGMPFNCHTAKLLLDADAKMKRILNNVDPLKIDAPFPTLRELREQRLRTDGRDTANEVSRGTRFWFSPDVFSYREDKSSGAQLFDRKIIALNSVGSKSLTSGSVDTKDFDPDARFATCAWTARMGEFYSAEAIWLDMYHIFSWFAVARMIRTSGALSAANAKLDYLLNDFAVPYVKTPLTYPSISTLGAKACGGVSVGFSADAISVSTKLVSTTLSERVFAKKPSAEIAFWGI